MKSFNDYGQLSDDQELRDLCQVCFRNGKRMKCNSKIYPPPWSTAETGFSVKDESSVLFSSLCFPAPGQLIFRRKWAEYNPTNVCCYGVHALL